MQSLVLNLTYETYGLILLVSPYVLVKFMLRRAVTVVVTDSMEKNLLNQRPFKFINSPCFMEPTTLFPS
jgi:hypothetical protein